MEMFFPTFNDIQITYSWGCYTNQDIQWFVTMGAIDKEDYVLITGEKYPEQPQA